MSLVLKWFNCLSDVVEVIVGVPDSQRQLKHIGILELVTQCSFTSTLQYLYNIINYHSKINYHCKPALNSN